MNNKVENIGNQYTSKENQKQRQRKMMRVVRRRIALFGGIMLAIIILLCIMLVFQNTATKKMQWSENIKKSSFKTTRRRNRIERKTK